MSRTHTVHSHGNLWPHPAPELSFLWLDTLCNQPEGEEELMNSVPLIAAEFPVGNEMTAKLRVTVTSSQMPEPEILGNGSCCPIWPQNWEHCKVLCQWALINSTAGQISTMNNAQHTHNRGPGFFWQRSMMVIPFQKGTCLNQQTVTRNQLWARPGPLQILDKHYFKSWCMLIG